MKLQSTALTAAALVAACLAATPAQAVSYAPGSSIGPLDNTSVDFAGSSQPGAFAHDYFFTLAGNGASLGGVFDLSFGALLGISGLTVSLTGPGGYSNTDTTPSSFFFAGLTPGAFTFKVTGNAIGIGGGAYVGSFGAVTTPVPEPGSLALLLAGVGVVGWVARRRRPGRG